MAPALTARYAQEAAGCLTATRLLLGLWCAVSTLEWAANLAMFRADGLLAWPILSLRPGLIFQSERLRSLFWDRSIVWVLIVRLAAAVIVMVAPAPRWIGPAQGLLGAMTAMIATYWFLTNRTWIADDGSDQMGQISTVGALLLASGLAFDQLGLAFAGNLLIAGQLIIAYFFGGLWKLLSSDWRQGLALPGIMGTHSYGHAAAARALARRPTVSLYLAWVVMLCEVLFPLTLVAPRPVLLLTLATFFVFHASHAYFMGLNTFVWSFATTYPSLVVLNDLTTLALRSR